MLGPGSQLVFRLTIIIVETGKLSSEILKKKIDNILMALPQLFIITKDTLTKNTVGNLAKNKYLKRIFALEHRRSTNPQH